MFRYYKKTILLTEDFCFQTVTEHLTQGRLDFIARATQ